MLAINTSLKWSTINAYKLSSICMERGFEVNRVLPFKFLGLPNVMAQVVAAGKETKMVPKWDKHKTVQRGWDGLLMKL